MFIQLELKQVMIMPFIEEIIQLIKDHPEMEILISEYIEPTFSDELIKNSLYAWLHPY